MRIVSIIVHIRFWYKFADKFSQLKKIRNQRIKKKQVYTENHTTKLLCAGSITFRKSYMV